MALECHESQPKRVIGSHPAPDTISFATPRSAGKRGAMPKRRYQEGNFRVENGCYYSLFYQDRVMPDGLVRSIRVRFLLGKVGAISELSARREHDRLRTQVNRERGSVPTAPKGETFKDAADAYMEAIAPNLSISTIRQRRSHLKHHLLPKFGEAALMALDVRTLQEFSTELLATCSRKTILNILGTLFGILDYAKKCGSRVPEPERIWTNEVPKREILDKMARAGADLWKKYDSGDSLTSISKYLHHCTAWRIEAHSWRVEEMFEEIQPVIEKFESLLPAYKPATGLTPTRGLGSEDNSTSPTRALTP